MSTYAKAGESRNNLNNTIDKSMYYGLLMFLKRRGRGLVLILVLFSALIYPSITVATTESLKDSKSNNGLVGDLFKKINFLSNPISNPKTLINNFEVDSNLLIEAFKGPTASSNDATVPDTYKVPKDLSGEDFLGSLKEIGLFVGHLFVVSLKILKDLVLGLIGYITK